MYDERNVTQLLEFSFMMLLRKMTVIKTEELV